MLQWLLSLLSMKRETLRNVSPLLKSLIHSDALTEAVRSTESPVDDLVLRILRALIPAE